MFSTFSRRSAATAFNASKRMLSGHGNADEVRAEVSKWKKTTIGMVVLSTLFGLYNIAAHDHEHPHNGLPYQHIRSKPYPWICSDCNLFDGACWDECRAAKNA
jgi:hypothetical protein